MDGRGQPARVPLIPRRGGRRGGGLAKPGERVYCNQLARTEEAQLASERDAGNRTALLSVSPFPKQHAVIGFAAFPMLCFWSAGPLKQKLEGCVVVGGGARHNAASP